MNRRDLEKGKIGLRRFKRTLDFRQDIEDFPQSFERKLFARVMKLNVHGFYFPAKEGKMFFGRINFKPSLWWN